MCGAPSSAGCTNFTPHFGLLLHVNQFISMRHKTPCHVQVRTSSACQSSTFEIPRPSRLFEQLQSSSLPPVLRTNDRLGTQHSQVGRKVASQKNGHHPMMRTAIGNGVSQPRAWNWLQARELYPVAEAIFCRHIS